MRWNREDEKEETWISGDHGATAEVEARSSRRRSIEYLSGRADLGSEVESDLREAEEALRIVAMEKEGRRKQEG